MSEVQDNWRELLTNDDDENQELLAAALAFIDSIDDSDGGDQNQRQPGQLQAQSSAKKRPRHKEEIATLRSLVSKLEVRVAELRGNHHTKLSSEPLQWEAIAQRQKSQRQLVEIENFKLRESVKKHLKLAQRLVRTARRVTSMAERVENDTNSTQ